MEEKNSDLLLTPSAKKNSKFKREYPFPIVTSECKENESDPTWKIAEGYLQDNCVLVHDEENMKMLYCMGFFGKGTLSKNAPKICFQKKTTESIKQKQRSTTSSPVDDIIDVVDSDDEGSKSKKLKTSNEDEVLISDSSDNDDCRKENNLKQSDSEEKESLQLNFQEAFFLSYGLGCLIVKDKDKLLNLSALWTKFCELTPSGNFPVMYTAYHHFRSKGWIVKNGLKFGTDYGN
ncbi:hypothetical protein AVEN_117783-1 [Araneus ventricosus]|uniref:tRNA-intron lyase n=1 Tax=Araneus ventricosus TaxID=182803 RepID=A0A4Y2B803_ARAVE|nr:hypothetical protein AVEN_117783-1 [Araneus ventricosus]